MKHSLTAHSRRTEEGKLLFDLVCSCGKSDCEALKITTPCKKCGKAMIWAKSYKSGKLMPVDAETKESHFSNCPYADEFRKPK